VPARYRPDDADGSADCCRFDRLIERSCTTGFHEIVHAGAAGDFEHLLAPLRARGRQQFGAISPGACAYSWSGSLRLFVLCLPTDFLLRCTRLLAHYLIVLGTLSLLAAWLSSSIALSTASIAL
jgi:hypothetical protein